MPDSSERWFLTASDVRFLPAALLLCLAAVRCLRAAPEEPSAAQNHWPEIVVQAGHSNLVKCVMFSPDGTRLATGSADNTVIIWDPRTGKELRVLNAPSVTSIAFSRD